MWHIRSDQPHRATTRRMSLWFNVKKLPRAPGVGHTKWSSDTDPKHVIETMLSCIHAYPPRTLGFIGKVHC